MEIQIINNCHTNKQCPFTQSERYARWQEKTGNAMVQSVFYDNGRKIGSAQWKVVLLPFGLRVLYAPHGPLWEPNVLYTQEIESAFLTFAKACGADVVFFDVMPDISETVFARSVPLSVRYSYMQPRNEWRIDLRKGKEEVFSKIKKRVKRVLNQSNQEYCVTTGRDEKQMRSFFSCMAETAQGKNLTLYPNSYYETLFSSLTEDELVLAVVYKEGEAVCSGVFIFNGNECVFLFGGSKKNQGNGSYILHHYMLMYAIERGCAFYNFGGISVVEGDYLHHVSLFKRGWGGECVSSARSFEIALSPLRYTAYKVLRFVKHTVCL